MADIIWSRRAERAAFRLPISARTELLRTLALLRGSPEMGPLVGEGRYRGYRRVFVKPYWYVYYCSILRVFVSSCEVEQGRLTRGHAVRDGRPLRHQRLELGGQAGAAQDVQHVGAGTGCGPPRLHRC